MLDQELRWNQQASYNISKVAVWMQALRRLARPSMGIRLVLLRQLYLAVAVSKLAYVADVWYILTYMYGNGRRCHSLVGHMHKLATVQRMAALAITGVLRTTATYTLDLHSGLMPINLVLHKMCQRA